MIIYKPLLRNLMLLYVVQVCLVLLERLVPVEVQGLVDLVVLLELLAHQVLVEQVDLVVGLVLVVHQEALALVV
jgi:hypothetical protein